MEQLIALPTGDVAVFVSGEGPPVVVLQRDVVAPSKNPYVAALAEHHSVYVLDLPGFGRSPRPPWLRTVSQLATLAGHVIDRLDVGPVSLVGAGFGGWVAADLATRSGQAVESLILLSPWGVRPSNGEIADYVLFELAEWAARGFHDHENYVAHCGDAPDSQLLRTWDDARESVTAIAWKPIGHSRQLPPMLGFVTAPTLLIWGAEDAIVPVSCAKDWSAALPRSQRMTIQDAGHQVELEAADAVATATLDFIRSHRMIGVS